MPRVLNTYTPMLVFLTVALLSACSGSNTPTSSESGSADTSTTRTLTGDLSHAHSTSQSLTHAKETALGGGSESCPSEQGSITVRALPVSGDVVDGTVGSDEQFSLALDTNKTYYLSFFQNNSRCGQLVYDSTDTHKGKMTIVGNGSTDIDLGTISDLGDGFFTAENNPSEATDSDNDGTVDAEDSDADGDGEQDSDIDYDGIADWADDDLPSALSGDCEITSVYPYDDSPFYLDEDSTAVVELLFNNTLDSSGIDPSLVRVTDDTGTVVVESFSVSEFDTTDAIAVVLGDSSDFTTSMNYVLSIPAGTFTCSDGTSNQTDLELPFVVVTDGGASSSSGDNDDEEESSEDSEGDEETSADEF